MILFKYFGFFIIWFSCKESNLDFLAIFFLISKTDFRKFRTFQNFFQLPEHSKIIVFKYKKPFFHEKIQHRRKETISCHATLRYKKLPQPRNSHRKWQKTFIAKGTFRLTVKRLQPNESTASSSTSFSTSITSGNGNNPSSSIKLILTWTNKKITKLNSDHSQCS